VAVTEPIPLFKMFGFQVVILSMGLGCPFRARSLPCRIQIVSDRISMLEWTFILDLYVELDFVVELAVNIH